MLGEWSIVTCSRLMSRAGLTPCAVHTSASVALCIPMGIPSRSNTFIVDGCCISTSPATMPSCICVISLAFLPHVLALCYLQTCLNFFRNLEINPNKSIPIQVTSRYSYLIIKPLYPSSQPFACSILNLFLYNSSSK